MMIHSTTKITYVPNTYCNLSCSYCYLGKHTDKKTDTYKNIVSNLEKIVKKYLDSGIVIEQFFLHGAEVTTIPAKYLRQLFEYINNYHKKYYLEIKTLGELKPPIHIKTNLYKFDELKELFDEFAVSISGSFDLPFSLHEEYRKTKTGKSTLKKILNNIKLLKDYKFSKQLSCVVTREHLIKIDEFIKDIRFLNEEIGFDMINNFYIMFGYDSINSKKKFKEKFKVGASQLTQKELVCFYELLKEKFKDTEYMKGINFNWFKEFLPGYCTYMKNCGECQILIQKNGDVYPCHRSQPDSNFKFGNIFIDSYERIKENAVETISKIENSLEVNDECLNCEYFSYCYLNCTIVRKDTNQNKSYTCSLQKAIYKDNPKRFPPIERQKNLVEIDSFLKENNIKKWESFSTPKIPNFSNDYFEYKNSLFELIKNDKTLSLLYKDEAFQIEIDGIIIPLYSQVLKLYQNIHYINSMSKIRLYIKKDYFKVNCEEHNIVNNNLYIMLLRDTAVIYGDEKRSKQEHIYDKSIYYNSLIKSCEKSEQYYIYDISKLIHENNYLYKNGIINNMFFTTKEARNYHYKKQANNGFYHIQAINLPFHNFLFQYENR